MTIAEKFGLVLGITVLLAIAGCMPLTPERTAAAQNRAGSDAALSSSDWAQIIESDRASVRAGQMPPEVIQYDLQIGKMIPEGEEILASHDQARARLWSKRMSAITDARNKATEKFAAKEMAKNNSVAHAFGNGKPDPCLSPMGKNICAASPAPAGGTNYMVGPGGIGATVGRYTVGPGGIGAGGF